MTAGNDESGNQESGKEFREKFEANLAENASLRSLVAGQLGVSADDLQGVPVDQFVAKADEIKKANAAAEDEVLRRRLGLKPEDDLAAALAKLGQGESGSSSSGEERKPGANPFASTGSLGGAPVGSNPTEGLRGRAKIRAALAQRT